MSRIVLSMMTSLDGAVARADGDLNWFRTDEEFEATMLGQLDRTEAILLGRVAYELLGEFWPRAGTGEVSDEAGGFTSPERERAA